MLFGYYLIQNSNQVWDKWASLFLYYRWVNWGIKKLYGSPRFTRLLRERPIIHTSACWTWKPVFLTTCITSPQSKPTLVGFKLTPNLKGFLLMRILGAIWSLEATMISCHGWLQIFFPYNLKGRLENSQVAWHSHTLSLTYVFPLLVLSKKEGKKKR